MFAFIGRRELSLSIVVSVAALPENVCLIVCGPLLELMFNPPSDSDGGLPLAIRHFLRKSFNLESTAPRSVGHHAMPLDYERHDIGNVFPSEVILFIERIYVH